MTATSGIADRGVRSRAIRTSLAYRFPVRYRVVWVALAALIVLIAATVPDTLHSASLQSVTALAGILAIASAGQLFVLLLGGIDISIGAVMTLAAAIVVKVSNGSDDRLLLAVLIAVLAGAVVGVVNGLLCVMARLNALIVTLAMASVVTGLVTYWTGGVSFSATGKVPPQLADLCGSYVGFVSVIALAALALLVLVSLLLRKTRAGRNFAFSGTNPVAADILGLRVRAYEISAYVGASLLAAVAGIALAGFLVQPDVTLGDPYQLNTVVVVILAGTLFGGGTASLACIAAAAIFLPLLDQYLGLRNLPPGLQVLAQGLVLLVAVALVMSISGRRWKLPKQLTTLRHPAPTERAQQ
jgi:ribose transport system permease protein